MNPEFYCKQCEKTVKVKVIQTYGKKSWIENVDGRIKIKHWKRYGKVIVLAHTKKTGFFKKIQCPNSNTQVKMVVDEGSGERFIVMSQEDADEWDDRRAQL